jgi:hypothetical protein
MVLIGTSTYLSTSRYQLSVYVISSLHKVPRNQKCLVSGGVLYRYLPTIRLLPYYFNLCFGSEAENINNQVVILVTISKL